MYNGTIRFIKVHSWMAHKIGDETTVNNGNIEIIQKGCKNPVIYSGHFETFDDLNSNWGFIFEEVEEELDKQKEFEQRKFNISGKHNTIFRIVANQNNLNNFKEELSDGESIYMSAEDKIRRVYTTVSIESAIEIRDYLNYLIDIADKSGYFKKKKVEDEIAELEKMLDDKKKQLEEMGGE